MASQNVLVYGATGSQARPLVYKLLERGHIPYVLTRHPEKAADLKAAGARLISGTLEDAASLRTASEGMDVVALLIPAFLEKPWEAVQYARNAVDAAKAAGVKRIIWNASGPFPRARSGNPMNDSRLDILELVQGSGVPSVVFELTVYIENLLGPWTTQAIVQRSQVAYPILAHRKVGWLPSQDLGALITAAIEHPEVDGSHFKVSGIDPVTGPELAEIFSQVLHRTLTYYEMTPDEMGAVIDTLFGPGAGTVIADNYRREQNDPDPLPQYHDMSLVLSKLPVTMTPIRAWIAQHAGVFVAPDEATQSR